VKDKKDINTMIKKID